MVNCIPGKVVMAQQKLTINVQFESNSIYNFSYLNLPEADQYLALSCHNPGKMTLKLLVYFFHFQGTNCGIFIPTVLPLMIYQVTKKLPVSNSLLILEPANGVHSIFSDLLAWRVLATCSSCCLYHSTNSCLAFSRKASLACSSAASAQKLIQV